MELQGEDAYHLAFLRCHAFVEVFMATPREFPIVTYAQRLGEMLSGAGRAELPLAKFATFKPARRVKGGA